MLNDTEQVNTRTVPDVSKTSRLAMGIGLILLAYVLADGQLRGEGGNTLFGFITFNRPNVLLFFW